MGEQERCTKGGAGLGGGLGMEELIGPEDTEWLWIASIVKGRAKLMSGNQM